MFLRILTLGVLLTLLPWNAYSEDGKMLYNTRCIACHTLDGSRLVGPSLKGVSSRKSEQWLIDFIKTPGKFINGNDEYAKELFKTYNQILMPDQDLTTAQIKMILSYINEQEAVAGEGGESAPAAPAEFVADAQDVIKGQDLFQGKIRFANGGAACNSCHDVRNDSVIAGGILAKELTNVFSRMGHGGVKAILSGPPFPVMEQAYKGKDLKDDEIHALVAFLQDTDQNNYKQPLDYGIGLFLSGVVGVILLFIFYALFWSRRKRGTVYKDIFDRQVTSTWE